MSRKNKNRVVAALCVFILLAIIVDIVITRRGSSLLSFPANDSFAARSAEKAVVAIATSKDKGLALPVPLDAEKVTYEQVDAVVRKALEMDTSTTRLVNVIKPGDWVIVKLNMVHAPVRDSDGKRQNANFWRHGFEHWG